MQFNGVLGAFNCQGGGWCRQARRNKCASQFSHVVTSMASPKDIEWRNGNYNTTPTSIEDVQLFALYMFCSKKLLLSKPSQNTEISLNPFEFELITISPVTTVVGTSVQFAPIGLVNMLNSGGAIESLAIDGEEKSVQIGLKGTGEMRAFASKKPRCCRINGEEVAFGYDECMVIIQVPWPNSSNPSLIDYLF